MSPVKRLSEHFLLNFRDLKKDLFLISVLYYISLKKEERITNLIEGVNAKITPFLSKYSSKEGY